jgi:hypothetical protein
MIPVLGKTVNPASCRCEQLSSSSSFISAVDVPVPVIWYLVWYVGDPVDKAGR